MSTLGMGGPRAPCLRMPRDNWGQLNLWGVESSAWIFDCSVGVGVGSPNSLGHSRVNCSTILKGRSAEIVSLVESL